MNVKTIKGIAALSFVVLPIAAFGCAAPSADIDASDGDGPIAVIDEALTGNGCPGAVVLGSTNGADPFAFTGSCAPGQVGLRNQYLGNFMRTDFGSQCQDYCSQSGADSCDTGWTLKPYDDSLGVVSGVDLVSPNLPLANVPPVNFGQSSAGGQGVTCYNRDAGHRWLAICTCR